MLLLIDACRGVGFGEGLEGSKLGQGTEAVQVDGEDAYYGDVLQRPHSPEPLAGAASASGSSGRTVSLRTTSIMPRAAASRHRHPMNS